MQKQHTTIVYPKVKFSDISRAFWQGVRPYKWLLFSLIFATLAISSLNAIVPLFYKQFFDVIAKTGDRDALVSPLVQTIIIIGALNGVLWVLYRSYGLINSRFQTKVMALLKQQAYDYLMGHSYSFFSNNFTGSLVQRVNRFARAFERLADRIIWDLLSLTVRVTMAIVIVWFINPLVAMVILIWALLFLLSNVVFSIWKIKYDLHSAEADSKTTAYLADTITNQNTVSLFNRFSFESDGYKKVTDEQAKVLRFNWDLTSYIEAGQSALGFSVEFLLFYFAIKYWQQGLVTVGFFVLLQFYFISIIEQLWGFTRVVRDIYQAYADAKEMVEILLLPHDITNTPTAQDIVVDKGEVVFHELSFAFNETRTILKDINLRIHPGEKVALVGPSGAGKTTFVRLLLRLYSPTAGKIFVDGQDIAKVTQGALRQNISLVPQDPVLFHRTLADNIAYGKPGATRDEIEHAAYLAHCDEFIKDLPHGLETYVGERGVKLSGGERQRVAIARAILKNAPILILDEATSSLDSHSELLIQDALENLMRGKTTLVIAHRLSTIRKMDRIIVIDEGKVIEEGSHGKLLKKRNSLYKKLWNLQVGGFLTEKDKEEKEDEKNTIENEIEE